MVRPIYISLFLLVVFSAPIYADKIADAEKNIRQVLGALIPDESVTRIKPTPFENIYEVLMGPNIVYMSGDGRYIFKGDLLDMQARENISENERILARKDIFNSLGKDEYIEFSPDNPEYLIYVFTDIDCAYCRRLHRDVPVLNENGVGVRYLAYPRGGINSNASQVMQAIWCAEDRKQALTDAKNGKAVLSRQCKNPVNKEYRLGQKFGVRGTPAIYTSDGEELAGYIPPDELIKIVKQ